MNSLFHNYPLIAAFIAMMFAQIIKFPIRIITHKKVEPMIIFSNGSMPSSHSAFVSSLTTAIGIQNGVNSTLFAIAFVFSLITMWDAAGIRYQASEHARILNMLVSDFLKLVEHVKYNSKKDHLSFKELFGTPLKELLGHKPFEVLVGAIVGLSVAMTIKYWFL